MRELGTMMRRLGGGAASNSSCDDPKSLLGVGNPVCLGENGLISSSMVALIVLLSMGFEKAVHHVKHTFACPMMGRMVQKMIDEVMILGLISMSLFLCRQMGLIELMAKEDGLLNETELFHFLEFIHYLIFLTMLYYIASVVTMVILSSRIPLLWQSGDKESRSQSSGDAVTETYCLLKEKRRLHGWRVKISPLHWLRWWRVVNQMGYKIARHSSRPVYEDRQLVELLFGLPATAAERVDHKAYSKLCVRAVLVKILELNWTTWFVMLVLMVIRAIWIKAHGGVSSLMKTDTDGTKYGEQIDTVAEAALGLFLLSCVIFGKTFKILMGIVNDRVHTIYKDGHIRRVMITAGAHSDHKAHAGEQVVWVQHPEDDDAAGGTVGQTLRSRAQQGAGTGANTGMGNGTGGLHAARYSPSGGGWAQMPSRAGAEHTLRVAETRAHDFNAHGRRFWFKRPKLLVKLVQFVNFFQAIYLAVLSLMFAKHSGDGERFGVVGAVSIFLFPLLVLLVLVPMTVPVLVLVLDLIGFIGAEKLNKIQARVEKQKHLSSNLIQQPTHFCPFCGARLPDADWGAGVSRNLGNMRTKPKDMRCKKCGAEGFPSYLEIAKRAVAPP